MKRLHKLFDDKFVSKWVVLLMDLFLVGVAFLISIAIRFNLNLTYSDPGLFKYHIFLVLVISVASFTVFKPYQGIIRHTSLEDVSLIIKADLLITTILLVIHSLGFDEYSKYLHVPYSIIFNNFFVVLVMLIASRFIIKRIFDSLANTLKFNMKVIIYGVGRLGMITKNTLKNDKVNKYQILFFVDDNKQKIGKTVEGIRVISHKEALNFFKHTQSIKNVELIFAIQQVENSKKNDILESFFELGVKIKVLPPVKMWINGQLNSNQIQEISIENLLERPIIQINNRLVNKFLKGKTILITGAAGSIGSEIVRQVSGFEPKKLILVDQAESPLYDLETEVLRLQNHLGCSAFEFEVQNICDKQRMESLFKAHRPELVFHAAAHKHVPLMEGNPSKAIEVNVIGTKLLADLASKYKVERFIFISTDKAVNPTNVMGASKRLAEMYIQSINLNHKNDTRFIVTRFGNVLGSNGSVIPLFKKQIERGGPVTVTHPDIIRYFMTIPEACQLVLEAGTMGKGGEVFVFDMGEPVKILGLAEKMIQLSGFEPYKQIGIEFSGLRPGEKLYEELLNHDELTIPTHHSKIMAAKVASEDYLELKDSIEKLEWANRAQSSEYLVATLKSLVPEFRSKNSPFEKLDVKQKGGGKSTNKEKNQDSTGQAGI